MLESSLKKSGLQGTCAWPEGKGVVRSRREAGE